MTGAGIEPGASGFRSTDTIILMPSTHALMQLMLRNGLFHTGRSCVSRHGMGGIRRVGTTVVMMSQVPEDRQGRAKSPSLARLESIAKKHPENPLKWLEELRRVTPLEGVGRSL